MSGSLFSAAATIVVGLLFLLLLGAGFIWVVPIMLLGLIPLLSGALFKRITNSTLAQGNPSGVPTSQQASYEPRSDPSERI